MPVRFERRMGIDEVMPLGVGVRAVCDVGSGGDRGGLIAF